MSVFCEKRPSVKTEPVPARHKADLLLAKTEPVGNAGGAPVVTYLGKGKKPLCSSCERGVRKRETTLQTPRS